MSAGAPIVAVLGLGEAGGAIAADLATTGADVRGWDPVARPPARVRAARDTGDAVRGAGLVLALCTAEHALEAARAAAPHLAPGAVYADLNTASPELKVAVAEVVAGGGARAADVALMAPVPGRGVRTPALAAGAGAERFAATMGPLGMPVELLDDAAPGAAATRKLLRSVVVKGVAAAVGEALAAARGAGLEDWMREEVVRFTSGVDLDRVVAGTRRHATRRAAEMDAAAALVDGLGVPPTMSQATARWHHQRSSET